jgi:ABC-type transport system involved in multi-copper enzyme maturation permease subunit
MRKYNAFWWILGITALTYPGLNYMFFKIYEDITSTSTQAAEIAKIALGNPFAFPDVWNTVAYFSSFVVFIPAVTIIMFISNEYSFKTHRQNIIDGWSRKQFITSKLIDVLIIVFIITVLYLIVTLVIGFAGHTRLIRDTWGKVEFIGLFALQTFAQLSLAFLIGFLVRKAFLALGIFLFYFLILEPIIVALLTHYTNDLGQFMPLEISDRIIPRPSFFGKFSGPEEYQRLFDMIPAHIVYTILLTSFIWFICYRINSRRDLK